MAPLLVFSSWRVFDVSTSHPLHYRAPGCMCNVTGNDFLLSAADFFLLLAPFLLVSSDEVWASRGEAAVTGAHVCALFVDLPAVACN